MSHRDKVRIEVSTRWQSRRGLWFTAGELARAAGVSVNTAKKYLAELMAETEDCPLRVNIGKWRNGMNCAYYSFDNWDGE